MARPVVVPADGTLDVIGTAAALPPDWDRLCASLLQRRELLAHYERTNPCRQRYHVLWRGGRPAAGAVVYTDDLDLLTFIDGVRCPVAANVVGLPASITPPGLVGEPAAARELLAAVLAAENGLTIALNLTADRIPAGCHALRLLPDMVLRGRGGSLSGYDGWLRSPWRRRTRRLRERFADVVTVRRDCDAFTPRHHELYLEVLRRSPTKLETLGLAFFQGLPPPLRLVSCYHGDTLVCWRIVLAEGRRLSFVLGGHDYALNDRFGAYLNNLDGLLEDAVAAGATEIGLGQTAEDAKARLGARPVELWMVVQHSAALPDRLVRLASPLIAYRGRCPAYRVFREEERP